MSFNKFYRYLTRNETTYVPPTLNPLSVEDWFPELDNSQKQFYQTSTVEIMERCSKKCSFSSYRTHRHCSKKCRSIDDVSNSGANGKIIGCYNRFFERYTSAAGIPDFWMLKQEKRKSEWNSITVHNRRLRGMKYAQGQKRKRDRGKVRTKANTML